MSDMERNKGKLVPLNTLETTIINHDIIGLDPYEVYDYLHNIGVVNINGKHYKVQWEVEGDTETYGFADAKVNEDGSIDFHTYHYNGGAYWTEVVESVLKNE